MNLVEIVPAHSREHRREIRRMAGDVMPKDKSWQVALLFLFVVAINVVAFVRWWTV